MRKDLLPYNNFTAPGVDMHCLYGTNENGVIESYELKSNSIKWNFFYSDFIVCAQFLMNIFSLKLRLNFGRSFNSKPALSRGEGDGTVNSRSLIGCQYWATENAQGNHTIHQQEYPGLDHYNILGDSRIIDYILTTLTGHNHVSHRTKRHTTHPKNMMRLRLF